MHGTWPGNLNCEHVKNMILELCFIYKPTTRRQFSGELLGLVHDEVKHDMIEKLKANSAYLTMCNDGWSNRSNQPIVAHCISNGKTTYLLDLEDAGSNTKVAEYCFRVLMKNIEQIEQDIRKKPLGCLPDNEAIMVTLIKDCY